MPELDSGEVLLGVDSGGICVSDRHATEEWTSVLVSGSMLGYEFVGAVVMSSDPDGAGPVGAGDTVRWIIGYTESGSGTSRQVHILVKPSRPDLMTNLVINTDLRTYHMELRSTERTYMASVSWQYPQDQLIALRRQNAQAEAAQPVASGVDLANLNFRYAIEGDRAPWRPLGPPLPGDLGRSMLDAQNRGQPVPAPGIATPNPGISAEEQRRLQEIEAARTSKMFAGTESRTTTVPASGADIAAPPPLDGG